MSQPRRAHGRRDRVAPQAATGVGDVASDLAVAADVATSVGVVTRVAASAVAGVAGLRTASCGTVPGAAVPASVVVACVLGGGPGGSSAAVVGRVVVGASAKLLVAAAREGTSARAVVVCSTAGVLATVGATLAVVDLGAVAAAEVAVSVGVAGTDTSAGLVRESRTTLSAQQRTGCLDSWLRQAGASVPFELPETTQKLPAAHGSWVQTTCLSSSQPVLRATSFLSSRGVHSRVPSLAHVWAAA